MAVPAAPLPAHLPTWPGVARVVLRPGTATPVLSGHPWIFSGALAHVLPPHEGEVIAGGLASVHDQHGRWLGLGTYHPGSQIAVRMLAWGEDGLEPREVLPVEALVVQRLERAQRLRRDLGLPSEQTDGFRLVNSEGDALPGLTVDRYADGAVVQISTVGASRWEATVADWLRGPGGCAWVMVRTPSDVHPAEGLQAGRAQAYGTVPEQVHVRHNGLRLRVEPQGGQKTGMYVDQRDNHLRAARLAHGRFVVDAYSHAGGFGLHAARAGAERVLCVDASQRAVDLVLQHAEDNQLSQIEAQAADAVHVLRHLSGLPSEERPGLVIVDPPKLATKAAALEQALKKYTHVNALAMQAVQDEGWLVSASCSGLVDRQMFLRMLGQAAHHAGRTVQLTELHGAAPDHPASPAHPEAHYLKVAFCRILPRG